MYNAQAQETERLIQDLRHRLARLEGRVTAIGQNAAMLWQSTPGGGGGGGDDTYHCLSVPAIAAGASGTVDVYHLVGGTSVRVAAGATVWNLYGNATTAGRVCTLGINLDGSYTILAQSCT